MWSARVWFSALERGPLTNVRPVGQSASRPVDQADEVLPGRTVPVIPRGFDETR